jgi:xanthine dehydrogenase small subunit
MRDHLVLYVNGRHREVRGAAAFRPLSDLLRYDLELTGTKIVCAEGDCGSCTVLVGRPAGDRIAYQPVTSCIQYLGQLDGTHVVTVEGLKYDGALNPVQQAMVEQHGAQCGFCTPGFVVAMCSAFNERQSPTRDEMQRNLVGNLCRCTGYVSILDAAEHVDPSKLRRLNELYPEREMLDELRALSKQSVSVTDAGRTLFKPATLGEATRFKAERPTCTVLAGGTDLGVVWNKRKREIGDLLCIGAIESLRGVKVTNREISLGACDTITDLERAACQALPEYGQMLARFGSPPIKNAGTIGGNIANGSPIGDSMPALMVLNAEIEITGTQVRRVNINDFYTGYRRTVLGPGELVSRVIIPLPAEGDLFKVYKISKRKDLDISSFTAAVWMRTDGDVIGEARIAFGGVGPMILRAKKTEAWLCERQLSEPVMQQAGRIARSEVMPISDVRGSAGYRHRLTENILLKFYRDIQTELSSV